MKTLRSPRSRNADCPYQRMRIFETLRAAGEGRPGMRLPLPQRPGIRFESRPSRRIRKCRALECGAGPVVVHPTARGHPARRWLPGRIEDVQQIGVILPLPTAHLLDRLSKTMERTSRPVVVATAPPSRATAPASVFAASSSSARGGTSTGMASPHTSTASPSRPH